MFSRTLMACGLAMSATFAIASAAGAQPWSDNFDSYRSDTELAGQGGWISLQDKFFSTFVVSDISHSRPNCIQLLTTSNVLRPLSATSGRWTFRAWQLLPQGFIPGPTFLALTNVQQAFGGATSGVQFQFSPDDTVSDDFRPGTSLPIVYDRWIELRVEVDLDKNQVETFYNDQPLSSGQWAPERTPVVIAAANVRSSAQIVFYDDFSLDQACSAAADLNCDGAVDGVDLGILLSQWDTAGSADLNDDKVVNGVDLGILLASWTL